MAGELAIGKYHGKRTIPHSSGRRDVAGEERCMVRCLCDNAAIVQSGKDELVFFLSKHM